MAKTPLNNKVDEFFKKYGSQVITEEIVKSSKLNILEINDYGNLLHAIVNYQYPEKRVLELIKILMDMGIDVNKRGKDTGLTFIHLSLYGYTDEHGIDHSYSANFITALIHLAINYGFDSNIKDSDSETIADAAIASEVYTGKIIPIIDALGPSFEIGESLEQKLDYYLKNSSGAWNNRLLAEEKEIRYLIKKSKVNPESLKADLEAGVKALKDATDNIDYSTLKKNYQIINETLNNLKSLIDKSVDFPIDLVPYQGAIEDRKTNVLMPILTSELDKIESNPCDADINVIREIISLLAFTELLKRVEAIASSYAIYKDDLKNQATSLKCLLEITSFQASLETNTHLSGSEIYQELVNIINEKRKTLEEVISSIKVSLEEKVQLKSHIKDYIAVSLDENNYAYEALDLDQLNELLKKEDQEKEDLHQAILAYISLEYTKLRESLEPLISSQVITPDDIKNIFNNSLTKSKNKRKKIKNES